MNTSSMGAAIDDLVAIAKANLSAPWIVSDGPWPSTQTPENLVAIGLAALSGDEVSTTGTQLPQTMGGPLRVEEDYSIVCLIHRYTGSSDATAQKSVRDAALTALAVFETTLRNKADLPQSSVLGGGALVEEINLVQVDENFPLGRLCRIHFNIHVKNILTS